MKTIRESTAELIKTIRGSIRSFRVKPEHTQITQIGSKVLGVRAEPSANYIPMPGLRLGLPQHTALELLPFGDLSHVNWAGPPEASRTGYAISLEGSDSLPQRVVFTIGAEAKLVGLPQWETPVIEIPADFLKPAIDAHGLTARPDPVFGVYRERPECAAHLLPLPTDAELGVHKLDIRAFKVAATGYQFPKNRDDTCPARSSGIGGAERQSLPRVAPMDGPPEVKTAGLAERLRWILTPPVNQLVADLYVPETPFEFQLQGIYWLMQREHALLADEMGLGKTIQAILAARLLWRQRRIESVLVICPKSLIGNWRREFAKWWPDGAAHLMEAGADRRWFLAMSSPTVLIKLINYEALAKDKDWLQENHIQHDLVIIDEAQRIKTPGSKTAVAVKCLRGRRCWALSGTPLENRVEDLVSIMQFVHPQAIRFCAGDARSVQAAVRPYILRRRLDDPDVGMQLPPLLDQDVEVDLTEPQRKTYEQVERDGVSSLNEQGDPVTVQHVFALISRLVQLCNFDPQTGESAKFDRLIEDFEEVAESDKKALIFSRFVSEEYGLRKLALRLAERSHRVLELHGQIPAHSRDAIIDRFNGSPAERALLINYAVGSVGLNLQAAGYVFLFDRWWNPAVEDQAIKRAHRFGQNDRVIVRRYFCRNTIEERILTVLKQKRRLFREIVDGDGTQPDQAMGLTEQEIFSLFDLKIRPVCATTADDVAEVRIDGLDPYEFEKLVAALYRAQGFYVDHSGGRGDGGIDVMAEKKGPSGLERIAVQCKHYAAPLGPEILRAHWGVVNNDQSITSGHIVTSSTFSSDARAFAFGKRLHLVDGDDLKKLLLTYNVVKAVR